MSFLLLTLGLSKSFCKITFLARLANIEKSGPSEPGGLQHDKCLMEMFASGALIQNLFMPRKPKLDGTERKPTTGGVLLGSDYDTERTRKMKADADTAEINLAKLKGELCLTADVVKAWESVLHAARAKLLAMPSKISPILANETETSQVKHLLEEALREALTELSNYQPSIDPVKSGAQPVDGEEKPKPKPKRGRPRKVDQIRKS